MKFVDFFRGLGRPIIYYPSWNSFTGGTLATILLANFFQWTGRGEDADGWIYKTRKEIYDETGLSRYEQESSRAMLVERGLLSEEYRGIPRRLFYKVNLDVLNEKWEESPKTLGTTGTNKLATLPPTGRPETDNQLAVEQPTSWGKTDQLDGGKLTDKEDENSPPITGLVTKSSTRSLTRLAENQQENAMAKQAPQTRVNAADSGSRKEPKQTRALPPPPPTELQLLRFITVYPSHRSGGKAADLQSAWTQATSETTAEHLFVALEKYKVSWKWKNEPKFIPGIIKWLSEGRWKVEPEPAPYEPPPAPGHEHPKEGQNVAIWGKDY